MGGRIKGGAAGLDIFRVSAILSVRSFTRNRLIFQEDSMDHGHDTYRVRSNGPFRIRCVMSDVFGPLAVPIGGLSHAELVYKVVCEELGVAALDIDAFELARQTSFARVEMTKAMKNDKMLKPEAKADLVDWVRFNIPFLARYMCTAAAAQRITSRVSGDVDLYEIPADRQEKYRYLVGKKFGWDINTPNCQVVIASNSDLITADTLLKRHGMRDLFHHIYTSDKLGVSKENPDFYDMVLTELKVEKHEALMIGNSAFKDLVAASIGIPTIWMRNQGETVTEKQIEEMHGAAALDYIYPIDSPQELVQVVDQNFVSGA